MKGSGAAIRFVERSIAADEIAELRRLPELHPEPVETVTSTTGDPTPGAIDRMLRYEFPTRAEELLARYSETTDAIEAARGTECFPLWRRHDALLAEMREEGARIRQERGSGR